MRTIAIYNTKGGVGKTTTAVNLSYLAAHSGLRILLWDLDPQAASTFAFRIRPHVSGLEKRSLENGQALRAAIKQTDYDNLYLLPADFAYHKFDRWLSSLGRPGRLLTSLLATISHDFDIVILDCPAGFSRLTEAILAAVDAIVAPTIPNLLSLRMLADAGGGAGRNVRTRGHRWWPCSTWWIGARGAHRRACALAVAQPEIFLSIEIPDASAVEQMAARQMPIPVFAPAPAARAFAEIWAELETRLRRDGENRPERRWASVLRGARNVDRAARVNGAAAQSAGHRFGTRRCGYRRRASLRLGAARPGALRLRTRAPRASRRRVHRRRALG